ncbi:calcium-activated potassium channel subunit beta-3 [Polymixia lowei]
MFLNTTAPRRSFSIPVNINLQGARRRQTCELLHVRQPVGRRAADGRGMERAKALMLVTSVGEDRAVLLGFTMMTFSVLMLFVVGITTVKPYINSNWGENASCVLDKADVLDEWVNCRGVSTVPCLKVMVNLTGREQALLHYDEESIAFTPECFYMPKCQMGSARLQAEVLQVKNNSETHLRGSFPCLADPTRHPNDVILNRKYTLRRALFALLWPGVMLGGGAALVGLVKLNQRLARMCSEVCSETEGRVTSRHPRDKLYKLLRRSNTQDCTN